MKSGAILVCLSAAMLSAACAPSAPPPDDMTRGRYLVTIGGCNDCHTEG